MWTPVPSNPYGCVSRFWAEKIGVADPNWMPTLCLLPNAVLKTILQGGLKYLIAANPTSCSAIPGYGGNWRYAANFKPGKLLSGRLPHASNGLASVSSRSVETTSRRFSSEAASCRQDQASRSARPSVPNKCIFSISNRRPTLSPGASGRPGGARMTKGACDIPVWKYTTDSEPSFSTISILA